MYNAPVYTILSTSEDSSLPTVNELKTSLEKGNDELKIQSMKQIITLILNGEPCEGLLMHIIRFVMPSRDKQLKKLLHFYWEVCSKYNEDGKLKQEMILVCNAVRNDLQHPNEFIRGATLRFLCKLREPELLEPLVPSCRACLEHRLSYVRKNAVTAIFSIYKHQPSLVPDAPELIQSFLVAEPDATCKRNAFIMLMNTAPEMATDFIKQSYDQISGFDELLQLAILEHIRKDAFENVTEKARYVQVVVELLSAPSSSVKYEAATSLPLLTTNIAGLRASAAAFLELGLKESDNNVKLIVLDRYQSLAQSNIGSFDEQVMDVLRILSSSPDIDVRRKVLTISEGLISKRNVEEVVKFLQKDLAKTHDQQYEKNSEYRELLIRTIHTCAIKFPFTAAKVVNVLIEFLGESNTNAAVDVISFISEVAEKLPELRTSIMANLLSAFGEIKQSRTLRGALWIVGEFSTDVETIELAWSKIRESIGDVPIVASEQLQLDKLQEQPQDTEAPTSSTPSTRRVNADGTYATESSITEGGSASLDALKAASRPPIRALLMRGDYFVATILSSTLTKLVLKFEKLGQDKQHTNALRAEAMLIMTSIIRLGQSQFTNAPIDEDSYDRILDSLKVLGGIQKQELEPAFGQDTKAAFVNILNHRASKQKETSALVKKPQVQVDDVVPFRLLASKTNTGGDEYTKDLTLATGEVESKLNFATKLDRIVSLSGFSDPVYVEAVVEVHQFDILLDILMVNMTDDTLQNVSLEFATLGDVRLVEKPAPTTLAPNAFHATRASVKVSSTETGVIFGSLTYDLARGGGDGTSAVVLNDIHLDIMDYIHPATTTLRAFRTMWTEFEWENKVNLNSNLTSLSQFLEVICNATNMQTLTPVRDLDSNQCQFLSANLYAKTIFGEDALANLSIEMRDSKVVGHIRIRSKAQGLALSLGDKVSLAQKVKA